MFQVSETDDRLANKDEVLVMRLAPEDAPDTAEPWAISTAFLEENRVYPFEAVGRSFLVVTSADGANRVYETGSTPFRPRTTSDTVEDTSGGEWIVTEDALESGDGSGLALPRVAANRAFWFGWYAQFPDTRLIF
jgi:hypothetical protein